MNICVFCSSSPEVSEPMKNEAHLLGKYIGDRQDTLVYGGATGGLMDAVAQSVNENGGEIIGIIPLSLAESGRKSDMPTQLFCVDNMSERKELMKEYADVFVVLPGGFGTLDEMFDVIASGIVGEHDKPVLLINTDDYWAGLLSQFERMEKEHMAHKRKYMTLSIAKSVQESFSVLDEIRCQMQ